MDKTFDELFDGFLGKAKPKKIRKGKVKPSPKVNPSGSGETPSLNTPNATQNPSIIDVVKNFTQNNPLEPMNEDFEKKLDMELGKPDKIEFYEEDGMFFEKRTWHTPNGDMIKLIASQDSSILSQPPKPEKSLQVQLDEAIKDEDYEKAASIRDKMLKNKKDNDK